MIFSTTSGAGLYLARFWRSFVMFGSSVGYGRYSSTSRAQRAAFGTPFASSAAWISGMLAVFAFAFFAADADEAAGEADEATGELCAADENAEDPVVGEPDDATGEADAETGDEEAAAGEEEAATAVGLATGALVAALPDAELDEPAGAELPAGGADADPLQAASSRTPTVSAMAMRGRRPCRSIVVSGAFMGVVLQSFQGSEHPPRQSGALVRGQ